MKIKTMVTILGVILIISSFSGTGFAAADEKLNVNTATVEQLAKVPGLNQDLAKKVIELRKKNGEFVDMEELLDVDGIDNNLLRALKQYIYIKDVAGCNC